MKRNSFHLKSTLTPLLLLLPLLIFISCNKEQEKITKDLNETLSSTIESLTKNPSQPIDEIKKLSQLEYKTLILPLETSASDIDSKLNELGQERWDCSTGFARPRSNPNTPELILICKRTPETVLRFIPKGFLGR